jgi:predicted nucleotidyltransferase
MRKEILQTVKSLAKIIAVGLDAKRIYLFGSYATGENTEDSDLDFYVIVDLQGKKKIELTQQARKLLLKRSKSPIDILIGDRKDFEEKKDNITTLEYTIAHEGIIL